MEKTRRSMTLPTRFIPVGARFRHSGMLLECVERTPCLPKDICEHCALRSRFCSNLQCSRSDRRDGKKVWFIEVKE